MGKRKIAMCGDAGSGKSTMAEHLVKQGCVKESFAKPIKDICEIAFGFTHEQLYGSKKEVVDEYWQVTPREMMQFVGTDLFRNALAEKFPHIGKNIWIRHMARRVEKLERKELQPVIDDLRFEDEDAWCTSHGFVKIGVKRQKILDAPSPFAHHESEKGKLSPDFVLENHGTIDELHTKLDTIMKSIDGKD
jgi:dephospho-CoA kinase